MVRSGGKRGLGGEGGSMMCQLGELTNVSCCQQSVGGCDDDNKQERGVR